jgi:hypothetical protein
MAGPFEGVRVIDLTTMVAGPVAAMMLADQGADVIKVESPAGDLMRRFAFGRNGMSASFLSCNRNKRSLATDLKTVEGLQVVCKLIATGGRSDSQLSPWRRRTNRARRGCSPSAASGHSLRINKRIRRKRAVLKTARVRSGDSGAERPGRNPARPRYRPPSNGSHDNR